MDAAPKLMTIVFLIETLIFSVAIGVGITVPFVGVLVRYRANYNPKAVQLDAENAENGASVHTGPIVNGYFAMMARVYRIEGWSGLYKGTMPALLSTILITLLVFVVVMVVGPGAWNGARKVPDVGLLGSLAYSIGLMLISLPTTIFTYRAITTPQKLPFFGLKQSLRSLLTPNERARPWVLYLTPGLLVTQLLHTGLFVLGLTPLRRLLLPKLSNKGSLEDVSVMKLSIYLVVVILSTAIFTPLDVMATRLAIQRNHKSSEYNLAATQDDAAVGEPPAYGAAVEEEVIGLRNEADPYLGFIDCAKRIIVEEGWRSLFRACGVLCWVLLLGPPRYEGADRLSACLGRDLPSVATKYLEYVFIYHWILEQE